VTIPRAAHADSAPQVRYERKSHGLDGVSRQVITGLDSERIALNLATVEPPIDYSAKLEQEVLLYFLEGSGKMTVGSEEFDFQPGTAILIPADHEHRHVSSVRNTLLVIWSPPPSSGPRHQLKEPEPEHS
jgi:mannose-6-phosphate isomerase-like protein (cupin superfamily)